MNLLGLRVMKESEYQKNAAAYANLYIKYTQKTEELEDAAFKAGVKQVFEKIREAIKSKNINKVLTISGATTEDLKMLVNGLLGKYVRKSS